MSSKSAAHHPVRNHTLFSKNSIIYIGLAMIAVYLMTVVLYPMIFNSERNRDSSVLDQPVAPPPIPPPIK